MFSGILHPARRQNSHTKLVVWSLHATVPPLRSSLYICMYRNIHYAVFYMYMQHTICQLGRVKQMCNTANILTVKNTFIGVLIFPVLLLPFGHLIPAPSTTESRYCSCIFISFRMQFVHFINWTFQVVEICNMEPMIPNSTSWHNLLLRKWLILNTKGLL